MYVNNPHVNSNGSRERDCQWCHSYKLGKNISCLSDFLADLAIDELAHIQAEIRKTADGQSWH